MTNAFLCDIINTETRGTNPNRKELHTMKFYWFTFADGYQVCVRGFSAQERRVEEAKHGKIVSKIPA